MFNSNQPTIVDLHCLTFKYWILEFPHILDMHKIGIYSQDICDY